MEEREKSVLGYRDKTLCTKVLASQERKVPALLSKKRRKAESREQRQMILQEIQGFEVGMMAIQAIQFSKSF